MCRQKFLRQKRIRSCESAPSARQTVPRKMHLYSYAGRNFQAESEKIKAVINPVPIFYGQTKQPTDLPKPAQFRITTPVVLPVLPSSAQTRQNKVRLQY